jgi:hypothetical protein
MAVGRQQLLEEILECVRSDRRLSDLAGPLGSGKTTILDDLRREAERDHLRPVLVPLEDFDPGHHGEVGGDASVGAVQGSFYKFSGLLKFLLTAVSPGEVPETFAREVVDAHNTEVLGQRLFSLEDSVAELSASLVPSDLATAWREAAGVVADHFVRHWDALLVGSNRVVLLLDNVHLVTDQELGHWLGDLLARLSRTVVVATREPTSSGILSPEAEHWELGNLTAEEVRTFLTARVARGQVSDVIASKVWQVTGGHPATLAILFNLIWRSGGVAVADAQKVLEDLHAEQSDMVVRLVERLLAQMGDPLLTRAVWAAAIPRSVSPSLLRHLLRDGSLTDEAFASVEQAVKRLPFTERPWGQDGSVRAHPFVRDALLDRMSRVNDETFHKLHFEAAHYYKDLLLADGGADSAVTYGEAYTYEDPLWQSRKREWLYHSSFARAGDRQRVLLAFARVFLDALWWWGNYVHFDFCDQLVADLGQLVRQHSVSPGPGRTASADQVDPGVRGWKELADLHIALRCILQGYPLRSVKPRDAKWDEVRDALLQVQWVCQLQGSSEADLRGEERHVAGLLEVFLAHTWRYQDLNVRKAERAYRRAAELLEADDEWSVAWVAFERADLLFESGDHDPVRELWDTARTYVQPSDGGGSAVDDELIANLHRLRGDCAWARGDHLRAAQWYGRAVLHAYLFHFAGEDPRDAAPDLYTLQFYVDIRARALSRLGALWGAGAHDAAVACAAEMARVLTDAVDEPLVVSEPALVELLAHGKPLQLALALFPKGPEVTDLEKSDSEFAKKFRRYWNDLDRARVRRDLYDEVWP